MDMSMFDKANASDYISGLSTSGSSYSWLGALLGTGLEYYKTKKSAEVSIKKNTTPSYIMPNTPLLTSASIPSMLNTSSSMTIYLIIGIAMLGFFIYRSK